ncbi:MAG: hypothetical protein V1793_16930 [Pseudomonadota bacterium]
MKINECVPQKISKLFFASVLFLGALGLVVSGFTVLPLFGFVLALPVAILAAVVLRLHLNDRCEIDPA